MKLIALLLAIPGWLTLWVAGMSDRGGAIVVTLLGLTALLLPAGMHRPSVQQGHPKPLVHGGRSFLKNCNLQYSEKGYLIK